MDPQRSITRFVHTSWTERQGAPDNIRALAQTTDGYLWLGTRTGLFHFDGIRFGRFESPTGEQLPPTRIRALLATSDGALRIVFGSGTVSRLLKNHVTSYSERDGLPATFRLTERLDGTIVAGTVRGLARFQEGTWKDAGKEWDYPGTLAYAVSFDREGTLWALSESMVLYLPAGQKRFIDPGEPSGGAQNFAQAPDGAVWISETGRSAHTVRMSNDHGLKTAVRRHRTR